MSTELTVTTPGQLTALTSLDVKDLIMPMITLRQNSYKNEAMKKFRGGDVIMRPDLKCVANEDDSLKFVALSIEKATQVKDITSPSEPKFLGWEPVDESKEREWVDAEGRTLRRDNCWTVYLLSVGQLVEQAAAMANGTMDADDFAMPTKLVLNRGSFYAGRVLFSHFEKCRMFNAPAYGKVFQLKSAGKSNDKGNWFVFDVSPALETVGKETKNMKTPKETLTLVEFWARTLENSKSQIQFASDDDADIEVTTVPVNDKETQF